MDVMEVLEDYEAYPEWAEVRSAEVRERGEGGRATEVAFEVDVPVLGKATYTRTPLRARRHGALVGHEGARGAIRDIRGEYLLNEVSGSRRTSPTGSRSRSASSYRGSSARRAPSA